MRKSEVNIPHFLINNSNFNYDLPIQNTAVISENILDTDQDGKFDTVVAQLVIEVIKEAPKEEPKVVVKEDAKPEPVKKKNWWDR